MRIVSLLPAATDIAVALGAADDLVAITHECDAPSSLPRVTSSAVIGDSARTIDDSVRSLSSTGSSLYAIDREAIAALKPDVIITQQLCDVCAVSETDVRALAATLSPSPIVVTLGGSTLDGVVNDILHVGEEIGRVDASQQLVESLASVHGGIHTRLKEAKAPRPRVAIVEWTDPIYAAGHWVPELVRRAGGIDVLAMAGSHSRTITLDEVRDSRPDVLIIAPCGYDVARAEAEARELLAGPGWEWADDIHGWAMDSNAFLSRPGPRLWEGMQVLASILHPDLFELPSADHARRLSRVAR